MQTLYEIVTAQAPDGIFITEGATLTIPSTPSANVLITCALQQLNQQGANGQAQIAITAYVQNGAPHEGSWPLVSGNNITSVTFSLRVAAARATATVLVFLYQ